LSAFFKRKNPYELHGKEPKMSLREERVQKQTTTKHLPHENK